MRTPDPSPDLDVQPLTPERFTDLAALFSEGGDPKWCWCMFFRVRGLDWSNSTADSNREGLEGITRSGPPPGLVGYRDGRAVGWVSLGPRESYGRLEHAQLLARIDDTPVWSIVCFVVSRKARRSGVAEALLRAAVDYARRNGATAVEAYPIDTGGERVAAANAFHGTLSMFKRADFRVVARRQWNKTSPVRPIVRLELGPHETAGGGSAARRKRKKVHTGPSTLTPLRRSP
jgi:GNAT superfamily N-acetyltransferase